MKESIKKELAAHVLDAINDRRIDDQNIDEWHHVLFNEDYYIIGYYQASEWLKEHNIDAFEAIATCQEWEEENFGRISKKYDNSEETVNMLAYIYGEEFLNDAACDTIGDLKEYCEEVL